MLDDGNLIKQIDRRNLEKGSLHIGPVKVGVTIMRPPFLENPGFTQKSPEPSIFAICSESFWHENWLLSVPISFGYEFNIKYQNLVKDEKLVKVCLHSTKLKTFQNSSFVQIWVLQQ